MVHKQVVSNWTSIPDWLFDYAYIKGLDYEQTGGGCDYIVAYPKSILLDEITGRTKQDTTFCIVLSDAEDAAEQPASLSAPCALTFYIESNRDGGGDRWDQWIRTIVPNTRLGIQMMCDAEGDTI